MREVEAACDPYIPISFNYFDKIHAELAAEGAGEL